MWLVAPCLLLTLAAGALDGAVEDRFRGALAVAGAGLLLAMLTLGGVPRPGRRAAWAFGLLGLVLLGHALPQPPALRALLAPGQAAWMDRVAPEWSPESEAWLTQLTTEDVEAAADLPPAEGPDPLVAASAATKARPGSVIPEALPGRVAELLLLGVLVAAGVRLGRAEATARLFAVGLVLAGVGETLWGLANRSSGVAGLTEKVHYLGSATGTFINRGHFAAFLLLSLGAAWGLSAGLFPLESDTVRRHRQNQRRSSQPPAWWESAGDRLPRLVLLGLAAGLCGVGVVASQSRGPLVGLLLVGIGVGLLRRVRAGEPWHLGLALGVPAVGVALSVVGYGLRGAVGRFASLGDGADVSVSTRLSMWREGMAAWTEAPLTGWGPGSWRAAWGLHEAGPHLYDMRHAHSELVEQLVELGLLGTGALVLLVGGSVVALLRRVASAEHGPEGALGVGLSVGVGAVLVQSLFDFPLHTPGVAVPTALAAGVALGALGLGGEAARGPRAWLVGGLVALGMAAGGAWSASVDLDDPGDRADRVGEVDRFYRLGLDDPPNPAEARRARDEVREALAGSPLDPWRLAAYARAEARLAAVAAAGAGASAVGLEEHVAAADLALRRLHLLRPRDPRLALSTARTALRLRATGLGEDAFAARARRDLALAVALDPWRAEEALRLADHLPAADLPVVAGPPPADGAGAHPARVQVALGKAWERRHQDAPAREAYERATRADPGCGPAWFALGDLLRRLGDTAGARAAYEGLLSARDRPAGMEAWALLRLGDQPAAAERFRTLTTRDPKNRWAWEGLAELARSQGDVAGELAALQKIAAIAPGDAPVKARIEALER